jgi:TPR repeat protein
VRYKAVLSGAILATLLAALAMPLARAADVDDGLRAARDGDFARAIEIWEPLAEAGDADARYYIGLSYRLGQGVPMNPAEAAEWFGKAAAQGNNDAQTALGTMLLLGEGVAVDYNRAFVLLSAAAEAGDRRAIYGLGVMHEAGWGVTADLAAAMTFYLDAAERGAVEAQVTLGQIYDAGAVGSREPAEAVHWYERAAAQGDGIAQYSLAHMSMTGDGVPKNDEAAYRLFSLAVMNLPPGETRVSALKGKELVAADLTVAQRQAMDQAVADWYPVYE